MILYTFYPTLQDGSSATFETHELPDDEAARRVAAEVLARHPSCREVAVWCEDRPVSGHGLAATPAGVRPGPIGRESREAAP
jgi:hypothetical protein